MKKKLPKSSPGSWKNLARKLKKLTGAAVFGSALVLASGFYGGNANAQTANTYNFEALAGTFTPLPATATNVPALLADGVLSPSITFPNGFTFNFEGTNYTSFKASSDGYFSFGTNSTNTSTNSLSTTTTARRPLLAPLWDDLDGNATGGSRASYEVTGTAGSQVFTFEWLNWEFNWNSTAPVISFQIKLYEATGKIEYIYRSESGNVASGSASIGIAGAAATNYISLTNTSSMPGISKTSSFNSIDTKPATGQIYAFTKPVATDISAVALTTPGMIGCYGPNQTVTVQARNTGTAALDFAANPLTVTASATGPNPTTFTPVTINTGTLAPNATQDVIVSTTYNMSANGTYNFNASATVTGDGFAGNNAMPTASRTLSAPAALPQTVDFTGFTGTNLATLFPGWNEASGATPTGTTSEWGPSDAAQTTALNSTTAKVNIYSNSLKAWIIGPKITATSSTALKYKIAITGYNATTAYTAGMDADDVVQVMVSTDCGLTFIPVFTHNAANTASITNSLADQTVSLASYAGQDIIVAFYAATTTSGNDYDFHLDDIFIGTPPSIDFGATALVSPVVGNCYGATEPVIVTIQNFGPNTMNFATNPVTVTVNVTGGATQTLTFIVNTGTLASGATTNVTVGTLNMATNGIYTFNGSTTTTGDGNAANNSFTAVSIDASKIGTFPHLEDFETFTVGTNATGYANGWSVTPANSTSLFRWNVDEGTTPSSGTGPTTDHTSGTATGNYIFTEASSGSTGAVAELLSPCINLVGQTGMGMEFWYHMFGSHMGTLNVDVFDGTTWVNGVWTISGQQQTATTDPWAKGLVNLSAYSGSVIKVRFRAIRGTDFEGDMAIDDVRFFMLPALDLGATAFTAPATGGCYSATEPVIVTLSNFGSAPINFATTPATITVNITGAVTQPLTVTVNTGTLAPGASQNVTVGTLNMTIAGTYTFNGSSTVTGDGDATNNTLPTITRTVVPVVALRQDLDFTGFTGSNLNTVYPNWNEAAGTSPTGTTSLWSSSTGLGGSGNVTAKINLYTTSRNEWIVGPKVTPTATTALRFKAAITDYNNLNPDPDGMTGTDDKVQVMVSTNCGLTFTPIYTLDATSNLTGTLTEKSVPLGSYAGQTIILAFYATDGPIDNTPDYDFHLDDVTIRNIIAADAGAMIIRTANSGCGLTSTENICVVVRNDGSAAQSNIPVSFRINNGTPVTETIAGPILPGDTLQYCFTAKANFMAAGVYNLDVYTTLAGDTETANDTISKVINSYNVAVAVNNVARCGPGAVTFTANAPTGVNVNWFTTATGGTPAATGNTYSPNITATTTYYYQADASVKEKVGKPSTTGADGKNTGGGLKFNAVVPFTLDSVVVYTDLAAGGSLVINLKNSAGTVINTTTFTLPAVTGMTAVSVPVNWSIPAGTNYTIEQGSSLSLFRDTSGSFPYTSPSQSVTITDGTLAGYYYFFFDWSITVGCTNPRIPVVATLNAAPATPTVTRAGNILTSSAATGNQWYLNGTIIPGATGQSYTATASGTYTVVATGANTCASAVSNGIAYVTGAADALAGMSIEVYPNPTKGSFNVKLNGYQKEAAVSLYNLAGQLIATDKVAADGKAQNIDIKGLAAGTYLLKVTSDKGVQVNRLIVQ